MPRRKVPGRVLLVLALVALTLVAVMDLLAPGSYLRALVSSEAEAPLLSPTQRIERLFDRAAPPGIPVNPFRR